MVRRVVWALLLLLLLIRRCKRTHGQIEQGAKEWNVAIRGKLYVGGSQFTRSTKQLPSLSRLHENDAQDTLTFR